MLILFMHYQLLLVRFQDRPHHGIIFYIIKDDLHLLLSIIQTYPKTCEKVEVDLDIQQLQGGELFAYGPNYGVLSSISATIWQEVMSIRSAHDPHHHLLRRRCCCPRH